MEPRPRARAALAAAVLLLRALGAASVTCSDCAQQSGPLSEGCPAGHFLQGPCGPPCGIPTCTPCQPGTYMAQENHRYDHCVRCRFCDEEALQMTVQNCSAVANTVCDCKPGFFRGCWDHPCKDIQEHLLCRPCTVCGSLNRRPPAACSQGQEECGACLDGFYEHNKECVSCPKITLITPGSCPKPCAAVCGWRPMFWVQVLLAALVVTLLLGATLIYTSRCRHAARPVVSAEEAQTETLLPLQDSALLLQDSAHTLLKLPNSRLAANSWNSGPLQTQEAPCPAVPWVKDWLPSPPLGPPSTPPPPPMPAAGREVAAVLQPGPQLYDVIDAVPARRWKEFVRTLGLREAEIEAVEVEVDRFRDQQYEMLKRWRQQESAGLGAVYRALERMGLDGCAEDLRGRLQRGA